MTSTAAVVLLFILLTIRNVQTSNSTRWNFSKCVFCNFVPDYLQQLPGLGLRIDWRSCHPRHFRVSKPGTALSTEPCWLDEIPSNCDHKASYRTVDGSCNNLQNPEWGQSFRMLNRLLLPEYADEISSPRATSVRGRQLPSPRYISQIIHPLANDEDKSPALTHMHMLWGQFIDHDISHTPTVPKLKCCDVPEDVRPSDCIPIQIDPEDDYWGQQGKTCMELRRSMAIKIGQCENSWHEQLNNITSYIDGGLIYGSDAIRATELRTLQDGRLKTSPGNLLPLAAPTTRCDIPYDHPEQRCYAAGDKRVNVWAGLTAIHLMFVREHNRIASTFAQLLRRRDPAMSNTELDEKAYQEARRIVGAELQVINYKEYLPTVLGEEHMRRYNLALGGSHYYISRTNPTAINEFATAAFRFGHSQIPFGTQPKSDNYSSSATFQPYYDMFNQPYTYQIIGQENVLRGLYSEPALKPDNKIAEEVRNKLFAKSFNDSGLDLMAVNIQRGRDHGLPTYNKYRRYCKLPTARFFWQLRDHSIQLRYSLRSVYDSVDDIDLFTGAITERHLPDAQVGPTFACIIGLQFRRIKEGDRFWFENQNTYPSTFTSDQISQLRQVTLAKVLCDNHDIRDVPKDVLKLHADMVKCDDLPSIDLHNWL